MALLLTDLIDHAVLGELVESLWRSSGLPTKIIDAQGRILISSGSQDLCFHFHRRHPDVLRQCIESDTDVKRLLRTRPAAGPSLESHCRSGLCHIGLPIIIAGQHLATVFLSQFFYAPPDEDLYRQRAARYGFDEEEYLTAVRKVPILDRARVREIMPFFVVLVRLLTEMGTREEQLLVSRDELRRSEEKFRTLFHGSNDALFIIDTFGRILEVNDTACVRLGYSAEEFQRMHVKDIDTTEFARVAQVQVQKILKKGLAVFETVHVSKTGLHIPVEISARRIEIENHLAILASARDLTERKKQEEVLQYRERFETLIARVSTRFMEVGSAGLDEAIEMALRELLEFAGVDRAYLFRFSENGARMTNTHEVCSAGTICQRDRLREMPVTDFPWIMDQLRARKVVHIPRVADLPPEAAREKEHLAAQGIRSMLSFPVRIAGKLAGLVGFDAVHTEKVWEERDMALLHTLGDLLGSALERHRASEALEYRMQLQHLIATLSTQMLNLDAESVDSAIEAALAEIGAFVAVDRCYVFQFSPDGQRLSNTHEWCNPDIPSAQESMQEVPITAFPWFLARIGRQEVVHIPEVAALGPEAEAEKAEFERQKIRSLLCVPMAVEERIIGFVGFDAVRQRKRWSQETILLLRMVGEFFANALERRRHERELRESQERIAAILRSIRPGLLGVDQEGRLILLNRPAATILGLEAETTREQLLSELPVEPALLQQIAAVLAGERPKVVEWTVSPREGAPEQVIEATTDPIRSADRRRRRGAITVLRDVSAQRQMDSIKSEFISTAAHELRTPLSSVLGYAELLLKPEIFGTFSTEEQREFLAEIVNKAEALATLIDDLLDLSRIESGQIVRLTMAPARLNRLIAGVIEDFRRRHPRRSFELNLPASLPEVSVDAAKIGQVLENLLSNAVKFSPPDSRIGVQASWVQDHIEIAVADEGSGMNAEVLAHIFDKFYRGGAHPSIAGLGLGMTIVKNIVAAHGGEVRVVSSPGRGTRVTFTLPL